MGRLKKVKRWIRRTGHRLGLMTDWEQVERRHRVMGISAWLLRLIEKVTNGRVIRELPHGIDPFHDIATLLPSLHVDLVFDVGANIGQSATTFIGSFPMARVLSFEPVNETFRVLCEHLQDCHQVECLRLAFAATKSNGRMQIRGASDLASLWRGSSDIAPEVEIRLEEVEVVTIDDFCEERKIDRIGYLKIDTEGGDLDVLRGAEKMLRQERIDVVQVEAGMNPQNMRHVPFEYLKSYLENFNYSLFGIYEQMHEWPANEPQLRRTNPIFISKSVILANKQRTH